jgi:hypothetical protein
MLKIRYEQLAIFQHTHTKSDSHVKSSYIYFASSFRFYMSTLYLLLLKVTISDVGFLMLLDRALVIPSHYRDI